MQSLPCDAAHLARLSGLYPDLLAGDDRLMRDLLGKARRVRLSAGEQPLARGTPAPGVLLPLSGTLRVYQLADDGREITLYRVGAGDMCIMSLVGVLAERAFCACVQAETDVDALLLDAGDFEVAMAASPEFRHWVLDALTERFCGLLGAFRDAVFDPLPIRLACLLGRLFERSGSDTVHITHQQLAHELGSTREVVSRHLKAFERHGCILLARGSIRIAPGQSLPLSID